MITLISSPNGYGHFFRLLDIANFLVKKHKIIFLCTKKQKEKIKNNHKFKKIKFSAKIKDFNLKENAFKFLYKFYSEDLLKIREINESKLIISDNLINKIYLKKKFLLVGNFLWGKITKNKSKYYKNYIKLENNYLKNNCLIQNRYFRTKIDAKKIIKINFTGKKIKHLNIHEKLKNRKIFYYKNFEDEYSHKLLVKLAKDYKIFSNCKFITKKYKEIEFMKINLKKMAHFTFLLSKPGLGTIKDSLMIGVPIILKNTELNKEYSNNAKQVKKLKIGLIDKDINFYYDIKNMHLNKYKKIIESQNKIEFSGEELFSKLI